LGIKKKNATETVEAFREHVKRPANSGEASSSKNNAAKKRVAVREQELLEDSKTTLDMMRILDQKVATMKQEIIVEISQKYDARIGTVIVLLHCFVNTFLAAELLAALDKIKPGANDTSDTIKPDFEYDEVVARRFEDRLKKEHGDDAPSKFHRYSTTATFVNSIRTLTNSTCL